MHALSSIDVTKLKIEDPPVSSLSSHFRMNNFLDLEIALCIWDFEAISPDELTLYVGDLVEVLEHDDEWTR